MRIALPILTLLLACSGKTTDSTGDSTPVDTNPTSGQGSISGTPSTMSFDTVAEAWMIGLPDDPTSTRVFYLFDQPVACADITAHGWDQTITDGTQSLEMKLIGSTPGDYPVATRPSAGQSSDNYTITSQSSTPVEVAATGGSVTLTGITDSVSAVGNINLTFPNGSLTGSFRAVFCGQGVEP